MAMRKAVRHAVQAAAVAVTAACAAAPEPAARPDGSVLVPAAAAAAGMRADIGARLDSIVEAALAEGAAPGAVLAVGRWGRLVHLRAYGHADASPGAAAMTDSTIFDLASVTKVVAATTAAMLLEQDGRLDLDRPLAVDLPGLRARDKAGITPRLVLVHRAGFEAFAPLWREARGRAAYLQRIDARPLVYPPGDSTVYSDWDLILTGLLVERLAGTTLDAFLAERVFGPLGMRDTGYNPLADAPVADGDDCMAAFRADHPRLARIAPTEVDTVYRHVHVHGVVHDENACALGGVAGHAGLFSSARDLAVFAQLMLNGGVYGGVRLLQPHTIARWTARQGPASSRALGWDTPGPGSSAGRYFSPRSFGHTGFTGTSVWIDPERGVFVILLTNRVNPTRANTRHEPLRRAVADAVQAAILDAPLVEWPR
jgi:CubicO group peptidase (beta-lactamase class C family)